MLVDSVAEGFTLTEVKMVVMNESSLRTVSEDIHKGYLKVAHYEVVLFMIGWQDVLHRGCFKNNFNKLVHVLCTFGRDTEFIFIGPIPSPEDS